jgi:hypothetical protein
MILRIVVKGHCKEPFSTVTQDLKRPALLSLYLFHGC